MITESCGDFITAKITHFSESKDMAFKDTCMFYKYVFLQSKQLLHEKDIGHSAKNDR